MATPYISAAFSGAFYHVCAHQFFYSGVLPIKRQLPPIVLASFAGFMFGGYAASQLGRSVLNKPVDREILVAFEERYMKNSLNIAGYNNNYISTHSNKDNYTHEKPY